MEKAVLLAEQWAMFRCVLIFREMAMVTFIVMTIILLISQMLIELCSGLEFLRSKDGKGICFTLVIVLVVTLAPWEKASPVQRTLRIPKTPLTPMTSLVAYMRY